MWNCTATTNILARRRSNNLCKNAVVVGLNGNNLVYSTRPDSSPHKCCCRWNNEGSVCQTLAVSLATGHSRIAIDNSIYCATYTEE